MGELCEKTDMQPEEYEQQKSNFLKELNISEQERHQLERETIEQANSRQWVEYRRKLLTASNFHSVCTRRETTSCKKLIQRLLYDSELHGPAVVHGRENKNNAIQQLEKQENIEIKKCGLFVHRNFPFLGATPDGIVNEDFIVQVKCPFSAYDMEPEEAIQTKKITFWKFDSATNQSVLNIKHRWYYQIQGQLQVTGKQTCLFGVWTGKNFLMKTTRISKDDVFWRKNMKEKLCSFYYDCLLPELIDPRHTRGMPIREPQSSLDAQQQLKEKRKKLNKTRK